MRLAGKGDHVRCDQASSHGYLAGAVSCELDLLLKVDLGIVAIRANALQVL